MHGDRLVGIEAQQPTDGLGGLALVAEGVLDNAHPRIRYADALRKLSHAGQALDVTRTKLMQAG